MVDVETLAKILEQNENWMAEHYDELIQKYPGKFVAIDGGQIVAVGDSDEEVCRPFLEENREVIPLIIEVPRPGEPHYFLI
jgi:Family of unknown function (DUF5678)